VRLLANAKKIRAHKELRARRGMNKLVPLIVVARDEVDRYIDEQAAILAQ
jgi:hypothetical protein